MAKTAADCTTMAEIRENIDRVDRALMALFAERWSFIGRAAEIKAGLGIPADVPERVREVRDNAHRNAEALGLDGAFYEEIWAQLINRAIAHEKALLGEE
ncbi:MULTISPECIES: chorismate mutase family protein [Shinella]|jgi:isochorismate pyruvate lyase|uniref:chorismate mutase n=1 Tax=Shinella granuli TaxID=323621 RepID=A0A4R2D1J9_SHIGR|nr:MULTISPECIES: chorismate mutase family protein [Shinella]ANH02732.1 chorismate mutase [Shinella sp. HZN7]TCN46652.1 isochorismate pyruvate lyase [Shinella granuli]